MIVNFSSRFSDLVSNSLLSQKQLAEALGVAESAIVNYKSGRTPKAAELFRIARHFDVSMEWLLTGHDPSAEDLTLVANSREATGESGDILNAESLKIVPRAIRKVGNTILLLRKQAEILNDYATELLIEAERLETQLSSVKINYNAVNRYVAEERKKLRSRKRSEGAE